ncbi:hypothetical protein ACKLNR_014051 [Fusarium oxysporum f. sp. zingiberi]
MVDQDLERLIAIPNIVPRVYKRPYPAISPFRPELSQVGKTVLIAGAAEGVGFFIARAFAQASASRVIILDINRDPLLAAASKLREEIKEVSPKTVIDTRVCNVADLDETDTLWSNLSKEGITVDILVLSAARYGPDEPILSSGCDVIWSSFITNVRALLDHTERFYKQGRPEKQKVQLRTGVSQGQDNLVCYYVHTEELTFSGPVVPDQCLYSGNLRVECGRGQAIVWSDQKLRDAPSPADR